jgi:protein-L-isoaspartate O-methyltransferase
MCRRVLEVGAGCGMVSSVLAKLGADVSNLHPPCPIYIICGFLSRTDTESISLQVVCTDLSSALEHLAYNMSNNFTEEEVD